MPNRIDLELGPVLTVDRVEVGRSVIFMVHGDDDTVEPSERWHVSPTISASRDSAVPVEWQVLGMLLRPHNEAEGGRTLPPTQLRQELREAW